MTDVGRGAVAGVVLASGLSRRFGEGNKLLATLHGTSIVRRTVSAYVRAGLAPVAVVVGHQAEQVEAALAGLPVTFVPNPEFAAGQSRALVRGMRAVAGSNAAVVGVGDQPLLTAGVIAALLGPYRESGAQLVVPRYGGQRGNPVLFGRALFENLMRVEGDQGGREVIATHRDWIHWVDLPPDAGIDIDTAEDLGRVDRSLPADQSF